MPIRVRAAEVTKGKVEVLIEPATGSLTVGEPLEVRVSVVDEKGQRTDRTGSAVLTSSDPAVLAVRGSQNRRT